MARIKINELPKEMKIGKDEMKQIFGGDDDFLLLNLRLQPAMETNNTMLTQTYDVLKEYDDTTKTLINNIR